ncbi:MAG: PAS domain S-box protein [Planctomycetota bacterium]|jgi:PAS domain S-box-containing protein
MMTRARERAAILSIKNMSFKGKMLLYAAVTTGTALALCAIAVLAAEWFEWRREIPRNLAIQADVIAMNTTAALTFDDRASATETVNGLEADSNVILARICSRDGTEFTRYVRAGSENAREEKVGARGYRFSGKSFHLYRPIILDGERIGSIYLQYDLQDSYGNMKRFAGMIVAGMFLALTGAALVSSRVQRVLTRPVTDLASTARTIAENKDYSVRAVRHTRDELGTLTDAFNDMLSRIQQRDTALQESHNTLEQRVRERTSELTNANEGLNREIAERTRAEEALREREEMIRALVETSQDWIWSIDLQGLHTYSNPAIEAILGYRPDELIGRWSLGLIHEDDRKLIEARLPDWIAAKCGWNNLEIRWRHKNGSCRFLESNAVPILSAQGELRGFRGVDRDITERKQAEEELARISTAVQGATDAIGIADVDFQSVYHNKALTDLIGYTPEELNAAGGPPAVYSDAKVIEEVFETISQDKSWAGDVEFTNRDGRRVPVYLRANAIKDHRGNMIGLLGVHTNITESKRVERELRQAKETAEAANQAKSEFLANMSHEIRTPMTAILGFADVLVEHGNLENAPPERIEAAKTIKRNGEHLVAIISDILDLSKIEAGRMVVERTPCSPLQVASEVMSLQRVQAESKGLSVEIQCGTPIPETIRTDATRLRQILLNLVGNAIKFTEHGGVRLEARLVGDGATSLIQFDVVDTGKGMTEEQVSRLFKPFTQADTSATREFGGTGLGLAISKRFAELLGGDVTVVESAVGVGARVRVTVATGPLDGVKMLDDPTEATIAQPEKATVTKGDADKLDYRILLAEDGPDNQRLLGHVLRRAGAEVTIVENGKLAIEAALAARDQRPSAPGFDVILMDIQMPLMDGYEATRLLRKEGYKGKIIALTAHAMEGDRERCLKAGCDDYTTKPIDRKELVGLIQAQLQPEPAAGPV